ncbi:hypothetical protein FEM48_Zijuj05G0144100 [Ziziphus jujuba var. spinosa]|uniref:EF-hand domain-containing protein n=1 Tax=Ziziphus jujuba var. spinosa TaxID=714518 RepID=A0A978VFC1_ZIZJJ|nr:hypothetical protein FEM48_Zijuj05G0144100 [Ziziphus jujuba var. spinosa]
MHYIMDDESPNPFSIEIFLLLLIMCCAIIVHDFSSSLRYALQIFICFFLNVWKIWFVKSKTKSNGTTAELPTQKSCYNEHVGDKKLWRKEIAKGKGKVPTRKLHNVRRNIDEEEEKEDEDEKLYMGEIKGMMERLESLYDEDGVEEICELFEEEVRDEEVKEAFDVFDENNDGFIDAGEIKKALCTLGFMEASEMECQRMIKAFDKNGDGLIDFKEFVQLMNQSFSN